MSTYKSSDWPTVEDYTKGMIAETDPTAWRYTPIPPITTGAFPTRSLGSLPVEPHRHKIVSDIIEDGYWIKMTGSRVTKDGWTSESDWDYVVYDPDHKLSSKYRAEDGWVTGSLAGQGEFDSIRKGEVNLIIVDKEEVWKKYIIATNLIKTLNSKTKGERIAVFDSVFGKDSNAKAVEF